MSSQIFIQSERGRKEGRWKTGRRGEVKERRGDGKKGEGRERKYFRERK